MSNNFDRDTGFSFLGNQKLNPNQLLQEVSDPQKINHDAAASSGTVNALELLNNVMKAFNTVAEMSNSQAEDACEEDELSSASADSQPGDISEQSRHNEGGSSKNEEQASLPVVEKSDQNSGAKASETESTDQNKTDSSKKAADLSPKDSNKPSSNLMQVIMDKIQFFPSYNEDEIKPQIQKAKYALSYFKTYEELLKYINDYFSPGKSINESFFFYIHSVYTLDNPELFINQFSSVLFYDTKWPHKGEIAEFLDSIPAGNH